MTTLLSEIEVVYVDSCEALQNAKRLGLNPKAEIRSFSPAVVFDKNLEAKIADANMTPASMTAFQRSIFDWMNRTYDKVLSETGDADLALLIARTVRYFQTKMYKFSVLREDDFHKAVAHIVIETDSKIKNQWINAPFGPILSVNSKFIEIKIAESSLKHPTPTYVPPVAEFRKRLFFVQWQILVYRLLVKFWEHIPIVSPKGTALIVDEGGLLKETAFHLACHGYGIRRITLNGHAQRNSENTLSPEHTEMLKVFFKGELSTFLVPSAVNPTLAMLIQNVQNDVSDYVSSLVAWKKKVTSLQHLKPKFLLSNRLLRPSEMALCRVCHAFNIPVVGFQHGVTREIVTYAEWDDPLTETSVSDVFFTFNKEISRVISGCRYSKGIPITVGMEKDLHRAGRLPKKFKNAEPIWYISTAVYMGNIQPVNRGMNDVDTASFEMNIVEHVLSRLPHRVLYKPYPAHRYPDTDPIMLKVKESKNIKIYEGGTDLRYLISSCRVLITSRPYSTLGWCALSGKPVVFIDVPGRPLASHAQKKISKGLFYVDGRNKEGLQQLYSLLSLPIEEIEKQWMEKKQARSEMIEEFFDGGEGNAGASAAEILIERFSSRNGGQN